MTNVLAEKLKIVDSTDTSHWSVVFIIRYLL